MAFLACVWPFRPEENKRDLVAVVMVKGNNGNEEEEEEDRRINELNVPWSK